MQAVDKILKKVNINRYDDDFIDRLSYKYTPTMFATFVITIITKQYIGKSIQCWVPAQFKSDWEDYSENYCMVENTYYVSMNETFPSNSVDRERRELKYYQWVPIILIVQLFFFLLPKTFWNALNWKTGINLSAISKAVRPVTKDEKSKKYVIKAKSQKVEKEIYNQFTSVLNYNKQLKKNKYKQKFNRIYKPSPQSFVTFCYLTFKFLNLFNCLIQLYLLNQFLGPEYRFWGWGIFMDLLNNRSWQHSGLFPRVTFCDVVVREQGGHIVRHTIQCVLAVNMYNEKFFLFIWFWLVILSALNIINMIYWICITFNMESSINFIKSHLNMEVNDKEVEYLVKDTLGHDGITCLHLISHNAGDLAVSTLINNIWLNGQKTVELVKNNKEDKKTYFNGYFDEPENYPNFKDSKLLNNKYLKNHFDSGIQNNDKGTNNLSIV